MPLADKRPTGNQAHNARHCMASKLGLSFLPSGSWGSLVMCSPCHLVVQKRGIDSRHHVSSALSHSFTLSRFVCSPTVSFDCAPQGAHTRFLLLDMHALRTALVRDEPRLSRLVRSDLRQRLGVWGVACTYFMGGADFTCGNKAFSTKQLWTLLEPAVGVMSACEWVSFDETFSLVFEVRHSLSLPPHFS